MAKRKKAAKGDYEVGRGKPPKASQYKPGQSGNRKGRPPSKQPEFNMRKEDVTMYFHHFMKSVYPVKINGEDNKDPYVVLFIQAVMRDALKGDRFCRKLIFNWMQDSLDEKQKLKHDTLLALVDAEVISWLDAFKIDEER